MNEELVFSGDLTIEEAQQSASAIMGCISACNETVLDITGVTRMDTSVLQLLIAAQKECTESGKKLVVRRFDDCDTLAALLGISRGAF